MKLLTYLLCAFATLPSLTQAANKLHNPNMLVDYLAPTESVILTVSPAAAWTAVSNDSWLQLVAGSTSGTTSQLIKFTVEPNFGATRTGTITIAGQTLTVTQGSSDYAFATQSVVLGGGPVDATYPPGGLALTPAGDLFVPLYSFSNTAGLKKWTAATNTFSADLAPNGLAKGLGAVVDPTGDVFIAQDQAIKKYSITSNTLTNLVGPNSNYANSQDVAFDSQGNLWITVAGGTSSVTRKLKKLSPGTSAGVLTDIATLSFPVGGVTIDALDNVYFVSGGEVRRIQAGSSTATAIMSVPSNSFLQPAVDGSGNVYVCSPSFGLQKWSAATNSNSYLFVPGLDQANSVSCKPDGTLYFAGNSSSTRTVTVLPRVLISGYSTEVPLPTTAGSATLPALIPATAADSAPFVVTSSESWLTVTNTAGVVQYSWTASETPRWAYMTIAGQRTLMYQGTTVVPTLANPTATSVTGNTVTLGATVTADGGRPLTSRGFLYAITSENPNPEFSGTGVTLVQDFSTPTTGTLTLPIFDLQPNTSYSYVGYAVNDLGSAYSPVGTFTTPAVDPTVTPVFNSEPVKTTALREDGHILVGGGFSGGLSLVYSDNPWSRETFSFQANLSGSVNAILPRLDATMLVGGNLPDNTGFTPPSHLGLLYANGFGDVNFYPRINGPVHCIAEQKDGSILIGGEFTQINGVARNRVARLYSNGRLDLSFNPSANGIVRTIQALPDGRIVIAGDFTLLGTTLRNRIARLTAAGAVDLTFLASANAPVYCSVKLLDGDFLIGGDFTSVNGISRNRLVRLNPNGTIDSALTANVDGGVRDITVQVNGKVLICGPFTTVNGTARARLAKLSASGALETGINAEPDGPVESVMLDSQGRLILGGTFSNVSGISTGNLTRLVNEPANQGLAVDSHTILWTRTGSLPEATEAIFEISNDYGNPGSWTSLGSGTHTPAGWRLRISSPLPPSSGPQTPIRARALTSDGWVNYRSEYSLSAQEIAIELPDGNTVTTGDTFALGNLGIKLPILNTFTIKNLGGSALNGITATLSGPNASLFSIVKAPATTLFFDSSTTVTVQAKLAALGPVSATLTIASNDADEASTVINLTATGAAAVLPVVTTGAASNITPTSATINGIVDPKGSARAVYFDYGTTTAYGSVFSSGTVSAAGPVSAALIGLKPHTTYNFRVRAESGLGGKAGANKTFTTANNAPVATNDTATVRPGSVATIDVLANDTDPDGDALSIAPKPLVNPTAAGTVAIVNNQIVFTAKPTFTGTATITHTVTDGFGLFDTAEVTIQIQSITILPPTLTQPSAPGTYPITITSTGPWAISHKLPWVKLSQSSGTGDTTVYVTLAANPTTASRSGPISIGGATHTITQSGVLTPAISTPTDRLITVVGESYSLTIPTTNAPVTYKVIGTLPAGLRLDQTTGIISGIPTKSGNFPLTISAKNAAGSAPASVTFTIVVEAIHPLSLGTFHGFLQRSATARFTAEPNLGGRYEMTTTLDGSVSGSITEGITKRSFKAGKITSVYGPPNGFGSTSTHRFTISLTGTSLFVDIELYQNFASGTLRNISGTGSTPITAWRIGRTTTYKALHTFRLQNTDTNNGPQGFGYGSLNLDGPKGTITISGKLPDGSAITGSTGFGPVGQVLLYQSLHGNRGSCFGTLTISEFNPPVGNTVTGALNWQKPASLPAAKDTVYPTGLGPITLTAQGSTYIAPASGGFVMPTPSTFTFSEGGVGTTFTQSIDVPSFGGLLNGFIPITPVTNSVAIPKSIDITKGTFEGTFTLDTRPATWFGQIVTISGVKKGYGFFLLPNTATVPTKLSGKVLLESP